MYQTIEAAQEALNTAELDVAEDMGVDALEAGWSDIVRSIAALCLTEVGEELIRMNIS